MKHVIERTSLKGPGMSFIGTCTLCGQKELPMSAAFEDCPNVRGLTKDQALLELL